MSRRAVITGAGLLTAVGNDVATSWRALVEGRSGGAPITQFDASDSPVRFAGEVKGFDPGDYMDRKEAKRTDRFAQFALAAATQAAEQAEITAAAADIPPERIGVVIGSGIGGIATFEEQHARFLEKGPARVSPFFVPMFIADIAAGLVSIRFNAKGPNYATVSACASSAHALGNALHLVRYGQADIVFAGGTEATITPMTVSGFAAMKALSEQNDSPATASRPFDRTRDGFVLGEGAGVMIIEELEHARRRGAAILAELAGYGQTADAHHITAPAAEHEGAQRAMRLALQDAGAEPTDVDYINAHGTSTPANDANETLAIKAVFGEHARDLVVASTKSMTGHTLGAAGGVEGVITSLVCREGVIPPTINYAHPDPECDLNYATEGALERPVRLALSNSFGFGGHNVVLAFRRWEP